MSLKACRVSFQTGKDRYSTESDNPMSSMSDSGIKVSSRTNSFEIENLLKTAEQVTGFCRSPVETRKSSPTGSVVSNTSQTLMTPSRQLTDSEKLRKVVLELVDTERAYVKVKTQTNNPTISIKSKKKLLDFYSSFAALEQSPRELSGAAEEGNVSVERRNKRLVRKHPRNRHVPKTISAEPRGSAGARARFS